MVQGGGVSKQQATGHRPQAGYERSARVDNHRRSATRTSFWMVSLSLMRFECGSVQMKPASMSRTLGREARPHAM